MACITKIAASIARDCTTRPAQGVTRLLIGNVEDIDSITKTGSVISGITMAAGTTMFEYESTDSGNSISHTFARDDFGAAYTHISRTTVLDSSIAINNEKINLKEARVFVIAQTVFEGSTGEAKYRVAGISNGMKLNVDTYDSNANNGTNLLEFQSVAGEEEACGVDLFWNTDEATTDTAIAALL